MENDKKKPAPKPPKPYRTAAIHGPRETRFVTARDPQGESQPRDRDGRWAPKGGAK